MLNASNMTHTELLGQLVNTCHISIQLVKRFYEFVDLMLTQSSVTRTSGIEQTKFEQR